MNRIYKDDRTIRYVKDAREIQKYLPNDEILMSVKMNDDGSRKFLYEKSGWYNVEVSHKTKGIYEGDICPMCESGEMIDMAGCMTCNNCMAQLKCGI
jgi:ribonucleoside-diphosphate reductase alpha chain